ncbi:serine/threonine protein kinase [Nostoc sp. 'Peltigera membranacea cyanobiont' 213]|uniref:trifunctional serine/threonine-protein kinase/ATP-binding protein/sensor histidine kinase n=1 Tax=Nostoc sp. 'Peltigera membranacea cyanobiont' 213 TaxID=2014530 RepID=UPI000B95C000|nr:ATP-binding sensor histidine kinase [Nostoc sp. 'Peltigera membranacea cyanobiont' 213]OYD87502.1 serine/threonine protein kinase [Nostoc sp. 'Peltigera membranacea cyanobiont' 213]
MVSTRVNIPGYKVSEELYNGSRTIVYRGYRETDSLPVVIKLLKNPYPSFSELLSFRNQYTIAKNLNSPLIVQTYSLEPYQNSYALVMEDFGGISLKEWGMGGRGQSLQEFLEIAIALCNTLDVLYHERIIHKDIKPANILINPETKQVKLIDFSIASLLPRETQTLVNPNVLEGTLAYISPEQTGRMNRGIDYRTDFYSIGVTFYELLTGELPFVSNDAMELVHCHIAKIAPLVCETNLEIPSVISKIVSKLMAKNAKDRYQSALGLKFDLENCLHQLQVDGMISGFEIGQRDVCDRFIIPDKLYGRETEVENLLQAFERVSLGATEMILVAGFSGIGKTAIVNEVHKPIVRQRGYFIKGKYDQFQRNIPFSAFVQAFRDLIGQLLSESDAKIQQWRNEILSAVGENGQVIIEVIPELSRIIGEQPPAIELSGTSAENRFNLLFQSFTQIFTTAEHPLVIFLDDLQWADSASLKLMQLLMADTGHLLLIGAYRDNEVNPVHPLMLTLNEIEKNQTTINTITLAPLNQKTVNQLVADTLKCSQDLASPLSQLVFQKTQGNPFFSIQFLKALHQEQLIKFTPSCQGRATVGWQCDLAQVNQQAVTDDVVEFMALQLEKLPLATQNILKLASCIGNQFDLATLAIVSEQCQIDAAAALWKALQEGLILPISEVYKFYQDSSLVIGHWSLENDKGQRTASYRFLHDRVQQAAYFLISDEQKTATHLKIGQLLRENLSELEIEEKLFDLVGHLNLGIELISQASDRQALAQLNFKAGTKAKNATAYIAARVYFQTGIALLQPDCWQTQYELALNLHLAVTEASYLNSDFESMEEMAGVVLQNAQTIFDKVKIYEIKIVALTAQSQILEAIAVGADVLSQLGVDLPSAPESAQIDKALEYLKEQLQGREIPQLIDLPVMSDRSAIAAMQLLGILFAPVLLGNPGLMPLLSATMVRLSLQFGNTPASTVGYAIHGMVLCAFLSEVEAGYKFGLLALSLLEKLNERSICLPLSFFGAFIQHRQQSFLATLSTMKDSYTNGMETGTFLYAGYSIQGYGYTALFAGVNLNTLSAELAPYSVVLTQAKQNAACILLDTTRQVLENLRETVSQPHRLMGTAYDETIMLPKHQQDNDFTAIAYAYTYKLMLAALWGNYHAALDYITGIKPYFMAAAGAVHIPVFHFYTALTYLALFPTQPETEQAQTLLEAQNHQTILHQWAENAPMNHLHKWYLVEAERYRVLGKKAVASEYYDEAIALAKTHQFINEEALANELAAKFYLDWGKQRIAGEYMIEAYYSYIRWGAKAKVADLERRYPQLLAPILQQTRSSLSINETVLALGNVSSRTSSSNVSVALDLAAILKASQTLSSEIELEKLLSVLLAIAIENAGADKCVLMLLQDKRLSIEGSINLGTEPIVLQSLPVEDSQDIPLKLIYKVLHNRQTTMLIDASADPTLANDPYIIRQLPKSILCSPILHQGKLMGILYLENNLVTGAFTSDRLQVLNFLTTQAAISLENALLYHKLEDYSHTLEQKVEKRTQEITEKATQLESTLEKLYSAQSQLIQAEKMSGLGQLVAGIAHEINNPINFIYGNLQPASEYVTSLIELNNLYQELYPQPLPEIAEKIADIELEFISSDLQKLLLSMSVGADRIRQIVLSLRNFSRLDESEIKSVDIHSGINSTLLILQHRLQNNSKHPEIAVIQKYGQLPLVNCYASALNQVFMNILNNAIDALEESDINRQPTIIIQTEFTESKKIVIRIADNGIGMSESVQNKIFNPFFTTKPVGSGTGLGLSTSYSIVVEKHGGNLSCISAPGEGTEFIIEIPL